jgi:hypothetical protein
LALPLFAGLVTLDWPSRLKLVDRSGSVSSGVGDGSFERSLKIFAGLATTSAAAFTISRLALIAADTVPVIGYHLRTIGRISFLDQVYHAPPPFGPHHPSGHQKFRALIQNAPTSRINCNRNNEAFIDLLKLMIIGFFGVFSGCKIVGASALDDGHTGLMYDVIT